MRPTTGYCEHFENGIKNLFLQTIKYYHAFGLERVFRIPNKVVKIVKKTS